MVDTVEFFEHVDNHSLIEAGDMGRFTDRRDFVNCMERLLHNVVQRLPKEEQFMQSGSSPSYAAGEILFGTRRMIRECWAEFFKSI